MKFIKSLFVLVFCFLCYSCGGSDNGGGSDDIPDETVIPPSQASLVFPENNTECNTGVIVSDTESTVEFLWSASDNTDSYTISVTNLNTNTSQTLNSSSPEATITILRGMPFSWFVTSKANGTTDTATSEVFKFYNAGLPEENHPPFPAETVYPQMGATISAGNIVLSWNGEDVDDDIDSYNVFIDQNPVPITLLGSVEENTISFDVVMGSTYYWKVVTIDSEGNSSDSEIFQFKVN